jgi:hypothetical protein
MTWSCHNITGFENNLATVASATLAPPTSCAPVPPQAGVAPAMLTKPHFCGGQILGYAALNITWTEENKDKFVRQWTRDCSNEPKPLVFDVDNKPLENPADAKGAVNVIDALKVLGVPERTAQRVSTVDELMKLGIDPRNMFKFKWLPNVSTKSVMGQESLVNNFGVCEREPNL